MGRGNAGCTSNISGPCVLHISAYIERDRSFPLNKWYPLSSLYLTIVDFSKFSSGSSVMRGDITLWMAKDIVESLLFSDVCLLLCCG